MAAKDLIPLNTRTKAEVQAIGRKGGLVKSKAKTEALRLNGWKRKLKRGSLTDKDMAWMLEKVENSKAMAVDMVSYLDKIELDPNLTKRDKLYIAALKKEYFRAIHGTNVKIQSVNVHMSKEQYEQHLEEVDKQIYDIIGDGENDN